MRISAKLHTEDERLHADFHATVQVGGGLSLGHALMWDKQGRLAVQVAEEAEAYNTLPITAAAVYAELGNIEVLLGTISGLCQAELHDARQPQAGLRRHKAGNGTTSRRCREDIRSQV